MDGGLFRGQRIRASAYAKALASEKTAELQSNMRIERVHKQLEDDFKQLFSKANDLLNYYKGTNGKDILEVFQMLETNINELTKTKDNILANYSKMVQDFCERVGGGKIIDYFVPQSVQRLPQKIRDRFSATQQEYRRINQEARFKLQDDKIAELAYNFYKLTVKNMEGSLSKNIFYGTDLTNKEQYYAFNYLACVKPLLQLMELSPALASTATTIAERIQESSEAYREGFCDGISEKSGEPNPQPQLAATESAAPQVARPPTETMTIQKSDLERWYEYLYKLGPNDLEEVQNFVLDEGKKGNDTKINGIPYQQAIDAVDEVKYANSLLKKSVKELEDYIKDIERGANVKIGRLNKEEVLKFTSDFLADKINAQKK